MSDANISRTWPAYLEHYESGELARRVEEAVATLGSCRVCPRNCEVDRLSDETKLCNTGRYARVSSHFAHFGEEDCLRGERGSGTIFFAFCNLRCVFCFHPDTRIATESGHQRIADLFDRCLSTERTEHGLVAQPKGLRVRGRSGRLVTVSKVFRHPYEGELLRVKPYCCPPLLLTPNHEVFATLDPDGANLAKVRADQLTTSHRIVVPKRTCGTQIKTIDVCGVLRGAAPQAQRVRPRRVEEPRLVSALRSGRRSTEIGRELGYHPAYVRTLRGRLARDSIRIPESVRVDVQVESGLARFRGECRPGIPAELTLDPELAWLLGIYCAEGHVTKIAERPNSWRVVFSFGKHETGLVDRTRSLLETILGLEVSVYQRETTTTVEVGKASAGVLFRELCRTGSRNKRVPPQLWGSPEPVLRGFLRGYLAGDGHETERYCVGTTVSSDLAHGLFELGLHLNVLPSLFRSQVPKSKVIEGRVVNQQPLHFVKFKKDRLDGTVGSGRERGPWKDLGDGFLSRIHRIESEPYVGEVYNLEVDDPDHSYLAPFVAVSNCQNWSTSQGGEGEEVTPAGLAELMLDLQRQGCHNVNFVTPEHVVPQILEALPLAIEGGLRIPLVYNTSGYDSLESLRWMDGLVDIYLPDLKLWERRSAARYLKAKDYREVACAALREMHRQVGTLQTDARGLARRGVIVRHLVMPGLLDESAELFRWLAEELSPETYVNVMGQYRPDFQVPEKYPEIDRRPTADEMLAARRLFREAGLTRLDERS